MRSARYIVGPLVPALLCLGVWTLTAQGQFGETPDSVTSTPSQPLRAEKVAVLSAEVAGVVKDIAFKPQQFVQADDLLVALNTELLEIETERIRMQLELNTSQEEAEIAVRFNEKLFEIIETLYKNKIGEVRVGSPKEYFDAEQRLAMARLQKKKALQEVETLKLNLKYNQQVLKRHSLRAPFDGVIVPFSNTNIPRLEDTKAVEVGETVQNGQSMVALMAVDHLRLPWRLPATLLNQVAIGQKARVTVEGFDKPVEGEVVYISPTLVTRDQFEIEVRFANPARDGQQEPHDAYRYLYRPGMWANVELQ